MGRGPVRRGVGQVNKDETRTLTIGIIAATITLCWIGWCCVQCGNPGDPYNFRKQGANESKAELYDREHPSVKP